MKSKNFNIYVYNPRPIRDIKDLLEISYGLQADYEIIYCHFYDATCSENISWRRILKITFSNQQDVNLFKLTNAFVLIEGSQKQFYSYRDNSGRLQDTYVFKKSEYIA